MAEHILGHPFEGESERIWKYVLAIPGVEASHDLPAGSLIVHVGRDPVNPGMVAMWARVDRLKPTEQRRFIFLGTGDEYDSEKLDYLGSVISPPYAWHVFEVKA